MVLKSWPLTPQTKECEWESGVVTLMLWAGKRETRHKSMKKELSTCPSFFFFSPFFDYIKLILQSDQRTCIVAWLTSHNGPALRFYHRALHSAAVILTFNVCNGEMGLLIWLGRTVNYSTVLYLLLISHCVITASVCGLKVEGSQDWELRCDSMWVHYSFHQHFNCRLSAYQREEIMHGLWFIDHVLRNRIMRYN